MSSGTEPDAVAPVLGLCGRHAREDNRHAESGSIYNGRERVYSVYHYNGGTESNRAAVLEKQPITSEA